MSTICSHDPAVVGPKPLILDGSVVTPEELVGILRRESPMTLCEYTWHPGVGALLTKWERRSPNQKYAII
jgi:hypothetical protein